MPTENRSSNTEMVSVPRELSQSIVRMLQASGGWKTAEQLSAILARPAEQHQGDPVALPARWTRQNFPAYMSDDAAMARVETWNACLDEIAKLGPLYTRPAQGEPVASIPDGYCLMPRRLTAENGAKALLLGEFMLQVTRECPECRELEEPLEGCEICDGEGEYAQRHTIPWDQIKFIYSEAVKGLALQPNTTL